MDIVVSGILISCGFFIIGTLLWISGFDASFVYNFNYKIRIYENYSDDIYWYRPLFIGV